MFEKNDFRKCLIPFAFLCLAGFFYSSGEWVLFKAAVASDTVRADRMVEHCNDSRAEYLFDCQCMREKAPQARKAMTPKWHDNNNKGIARMEKQKSQLQERLEDETNSGRIKGIKRSIEDHRQRIAKAKVAKPSFSEQQIMKQIEEMGVCRAREGVYKRQLQGCNNTVSADDPPGFCECVAGKVADAWVESGTTSNLSALQSVGVKARRACSE